MQRARQGLVKLTSGKVEPNISISGANPIKIYIKCGFLGLGGRRGLGKTQVFFSWGLYHE